MKSRWYIGAFVFFLTLIAVVNQQQSIVPNQELVLEFTNSEISQADAQGTVAVVTTQLQRLGAENIQVKEEADGRLRITYYSATDVIQVREALAKDNALVINNPIGDQEQSGSEIPLDDKTISCNLDVYEIQNDNGALSGFGGKSILPLNHKSDRSYFPDVHFYSNYIDNDITNTIEVAYKVHHTMALAIEESVHVIPEVRAGPIC
ncbi:hypothetical protein [Aestuariivivens insulae]|uniref:hypothetical protein n=1 Tax=Aestuariivivens insulae TaxID=1621988 RepID=UPI001F561780|nr:hypothetical protein [Aestuariivivens insulae]